LSCFYLIQPLPEFARIIFFRDIGCIEECYLLRYDAVWSVTSKATFRNSMLPLSPGSKNKPHNKPAGRATCFPASSWSIYSTLNMETKCSSETSVAFERTIPRYEYVPQDRTLHNHPCGNLESHTGPSDQRWNSVSTSTLTIASSWLLNSVNQLYSTFLVLISPDVISLQLFTPKFLGV
jgi:hypothetical protein